MYRLKIASEHGKASYLCVLLVKLRYLSLDAVPSLLLDIVLATQYPMMHRSEPSLASSTLLLPNRPKCPTSSWRMSGVYCSRNQSVREKVLSS